MKRCYEVASRSQRTRMETVSLLPPSGSSNFRKKLQYIQKHYRQFQEQVIIISLKILITFGHATSTPQLTKPTVSLFGKRVFCRPVHHIWKRRIFSFTRGLVMVMFMVVEYFIQYICQGFILYYGTILKMQPIVIVSKVDRIH